MSTRLAPAAVAAAALLIAACGSSTSSTDEFKGADKQVAQVVEDLSKAGRDKDAKRICDQLLAPDVVRRLRTSGRDCTSAIDGALDDADNFELLVKDVRVTGSTARARVESGGDKDEVETLQLVRVGGGWRIATLGG